MVIQVWDDWHNERPGYFRAFWCDSAESTVGSPVVGYCSAGGSHSTIRATIAELRRLGHNEPVYRNGELVTGAWLVCIDTYSLEPGEIGKHATPVARFAHRTPAAALRRLGSCIKGKLRRQFASARRFYVIGPDGGEWTWTALRNHLWSA